LFLQIYIYLFMNKSYIIRLLLVFSIFLCSFVAVWGQNDSIVNSVYQRKTYAPEAVVPFYDTLFHIRSGVGSFTAHERAVSISEKIRKVFRMYDNFNTDSLFIIAEGGLTEIVYRDIIIMSITEADAKLNGKTQMSLAHEYEKIIEDAIVKRQKDTGWLAILLRTLLILLIITVQYFLIRIVNYLFRKISAAVEQQKGKRIKAIKIKSYTLMDEDKTTGFVLFLKKVLHYLLVILMFFFSIPLVFRVFPATRGFADILLGYVLDPIKTISFGIVGFIPNLFKILIIVLVFRYLIKGIRFLAGEIENKRLKIKGFYPDWAFPTFHIIRILLYAFMFIVIYQLIPNSESEVFKGVSVFIGILFTLGSTSIIGNVVSGLVLTYMRPFKTGDRIRIGDLVGNVVEKTPLVTRIRTPKNEEVTIPNSNIMSAQTFNYSHSARTYGLILHTELTFGYDTPWRQVHELLFDAAKRTPDALENPKPFILQTALDEFYARYQLNIYIRDADKMPQIYSDLHQNIQDVFHEAGIELIVPHYQSHRDGSRSALPPSYLQEDYQAPLFHVKVEK